jgi:hypothetical protein
MRVDHLYVLSMLAALDTDPDKKLETSRTAKALYDRHGKKAKTAALVEIPNSWCSKFDSKVLETSGDNVPLGVGTEQPSPEKDKPTSTLVDKGLEGKKEQVLSKTSAGLYLVFHSDGGGAVLLPKDVANVVATVVPQPLHASITKMVKFQQRYQMRHRKSRDEDARWGFNSAISSFCVRWLHPSPPRLLSPRAIALNHLDGSVRKNLLC